MKNKGTVIFTFVLIVLALFGIWKFALKEDKMDYQQKGVNESNNNVSGGFAGNYRGKIYYSDKGAFYETNLQFKEHKKLLDFEVENFIFVEDKLYCRRHIPPYIMYSLDLATGESRKVGEYEPAEMQRLGKYLYFSRFEDYPPLSIYRFSLEDEKSEKIRATEAEYLMIFKDTLYYAKWGLYGRVMYLDENGEENMYSADANINVIASDEKNIYYSWDGVYRINEDKTLDKLSNVQTGFINVYQDEIYFNSREGFFKMDINGQNIKKLSDEKDIARFSVLDRDVIIAKKFAQTDLEETVLIRKNVNGDYETVSLQELIK